MLYRKYENQNIVWAIWKVDETIEELESLLQITISETNLKRKKEILATRLLLNTLLGDNTSIFYKETGKPFLKNGYFISISHTKNYVAISLSRTRETGIDIETTSEKVLRVKDRFISEKEFIDTQNELNHLLIHWTAKEAVFKIVDNGRECLKNDFILNHLTPMNEGKFVINDSRGKTSYEGFYLVEKEFVLSVI